MISRLSGKLLSKNATEVVIDCNGVGFSAYISLSTYAQLPAPGNDVELQTLLISREDSLTLYGFHEDSERNAFKQLISISGIGAKTAIAVLSSLSVTELQEYIATANSVALQKLPGIGKKTAERIILELKDKISRLYAGEPTGTSGGVSNVIKQEAVLALVALGFSNLSAEKAVNKVLVVNTQDISVEFLIRQVLKNSAK
jgi:Holliday junction DNA helicase RuvA